MFENRTEPPFGAIRTGNSSTASFRYQLVGWCELIATETVKARAHGNHSEMIDRFLLDALDASSELSCLSAVELTRKLLCADLILQLAKALSEGAFSAADVEEIESQVREAYDALETPDSALIADMESQGAGYLPESRVAAVGAERFALMETIGAALVSVAKTVRSAMAYSFSASDSLEFKAEGLRNYLNGLRPKERRERRDQITQEAEALEARAKDWRDQVRFVLDGIVDALVVAASPDADDDALFDVFEKVGRINATALELEERGVRSRYDAPKPIGVQSTPYREGKCVLYVGEDLDVLATLLEQADYNGVNVWTYGDAVATHAYRDALPCKNRLAGQYGGAWRSQRREFDAFPGSIVVDKATLDEPMSSYEDYIFSTTPTIWGGVKTLSLKEGAKDDAPQYDMTPALLGARDSAGFFREPAERRYFPTGFGGKELDDIVLKAADAFRTDQLKQVVVIGGQDVPGDDVDYFARLFSSVGDNSFVVSFGDVKFRFDHERFGLTPFGVTRVVDVGRERDANAALRFASAFARELDKDATTVPVRFFLSLWSEASAAFLLSLCSLGYRGVAVGPLVPASWTPAFQEKLRERYGVVLTSSDPEADLA